MKGRAVPVARGVVLLGVLALAGCVGRPVIENRYGRLEPTIAIGEPVLQLAVVTAAVEAATGGVPLTALSDRGQAALIRETKGKPPTVVQDEPGGGDGLEMLDSVERHLLVSTRPRGFLAPGDRIDAVRIELAVAPEQAADWRIVGWTQASNGQKVIEIGKLTDASTRSLTASAGLKPGGPVPEASLGAEASRAVTRETILTDTNDFDAAVDEHGSAWLDETAGWRTNLARNLSMDAVIGAQPAVRRIERHRAVSSGLGDGRGGPAAAREVRLIDIPFIEPAAAGRPICGIARMTYRLRHVLNKGGATFSESDDHIEFRVGQAQARFLLAPAPYRALYALVSEGRELAWTSGEGPRRSLAFASIAEATAFRDWMQQAGISAGRIGNARIGFTTGPNGVIAPLARADLATLVPATMDARRVLAARSAGAASCGTPPDAAAER